MSRLATWTRFNFLHPNFFLSTLVIEKRERGKIAEACVCHVRYLEDFRLMKIKLKNFIRLLVYNNPLVDTIGCLDEFDLWIIPWLERNCSSIVDDWKMLKKKRTKVGRKKTALKIKIVCIQGKEERMSKMAHLESAAECFKDRIGDIIFDNKWFIIFWNLSLPRNKMRNQNTKENLK